MRVRCLCVNSLTLLICELGLCFCVQECWKTDWKRGVVGCGDRRCLRSRARNLIRLVPFTCYFHLNCIERLVLFSTTVLYEFKHLFGYILIFVVHVLLEHSDCVSCVYSLIVYQG